MQQTLRGFSYRGGKYCNRRYFSTNKNHRISGSTLDIDNAAGKLVKFLLDSDCINFMVGAKLNQVHYNPALPIEIKIRKNIIKRMAKVLQDKYSKKVTVQYM